MTLLARDEADVIESWLSFHLNAGADFVVATDNRSQDGTTDVLERYAREGHLHLIREDGDDLRQNEWVTRMARLAATDFGADWVINSDADEFWWPRGASLAHVLDAIPPRYGTVGAFLRTFAPRPDSDEPFAERLTVRFSALAPINDPGVALQADPEGHPSRAPGDHADARQPRGRRQPVRPAPRLVPGRGPALPAPLGRPVRAQGAAAGERVEAHRPDADRVPRADVRGARRRHDRGVLRRAGRHRRGGRARRRGGPPRRRHEAARRAAADRRG